MADESEWKAGIYRVEENYSEKTDETLKQSEDFVKEGKIDEALESLLALEKTARLGNDTKSTLRLAKRVVTMLIEAKSWEKMLEHVELLMKKRAQMKQVQAMVIQEAVKAVPMTTGETKIQVIQKLRSICEGKLHVELECARLTVELVNIWDSLGKLKEATTLMQQLQVETIGNMERKEKFDIILQQMEMCLRMEDYVVAHIMAKKIPIRTIDKPDTLSHKIRFYTLLIQYYKHKKNHLMICKCYIEIYNTVFSTDFVHDGVEYATPESRIEVLQQAISFLLLAPYNSKLETLDEEKTGYTKDQLAQDQKESGEVKRTVDIHSNEKLRLLERFKNDKNMEQLPLLRGAISKFIDLELIVWPEFEQELAVLKTHSIFQDHSERWGILQTRTIEHNIRVMSTYYKRVSHSRMAHMIGMGADETEEFLCEMVSAKLVFAKLNRPEGVIEFRQEKTTAQHLNQWSSGVNQVLSLLGTTCHLITKEQMVHKAKQSKK